MKSFNDKYLFGSNGKIYQLSYNVVFYFIDLTPPTVQCPESIFAETDFGQSYKEISWSPPTIIDNSISGSDDISLTHTPAEIKSPHKFPIGVTLIKYNASDAFGNFDECVFRVQIIGMIFFFYQIFIELCILIHLPQFLISNIYTSQYLF